MVLVDTSVWVDYLRGGDDILARLLLKGQVCMHPMIIGELACGHLQSRQQLMGLWNNLPSVATANHEEALFFLDTHALAGKGIGWVDLHLLAASLLSGNTKLWTRDKRLARIADGLGVGFSAD